MSAPLSEAGWLFWSLACVGSFCLTVSLLFFACTRSYCPHIRIPLRERVWNLAFAGGMAFASWEARQRLGFW